jgi:FAD/FMN-containing dehydrogenase
MPTRSLRITSASTTDTTETTLLGITKPNKPAAPTRRAPATRSTKKPKTASKSALKVTTKTRQPKAATKAAKAQNATNKKAAPTKASKTRKTAKAPAKKTLTTKKASTSANQLSTTGRKPTHPLGHLLFAKLLKEAGFRGTVSASKIDLETYSTDESIFSVRPQVVLTPHNRTDIEIATRVVASESKRFPSLSLTPRAAGTGLGGGSLTDSVVLNLKNLDKRSTPIRKKSGVTITVEPGALWRDVEADLKKEGVYIPSYPASKDICTVGGGVCNNAAGPDSLRYGHCASWIESLDVVLGDGHTYTVKPLSYREFILLTKQKHEHARIAREIYDLIKKNEKLIGTARPKTAKNSAGYALWDVLPLGTAAFEKGEGVFDLTQLIAGSQGTIGIVASFTMKTVPIETDTSLIAIPIFNLDDAASAITSALKYDPINVEVFDGHSYELALANPTFFKDRLAGAQYYKVLLKMYTNYHVRYKRTTPEFIVLVTLDPKTTQAHPMPDVLASITTNTVKPRHVTNPVEAEMFWQIRRASYTLSKFQDTTKRPAAFLEDMTVPPENLSKFFAEIKTLLRKFRVTAAVHGHGGNGHFHFYPLLDFTDPKTPDLVEAMSEAFFSCAIKHKGNICGEHNDGIIRTPHLNKMFKKNVLALFEQTERIFDPLDVFNPGKKVNPRFAVKDVLRKTN